MREFTRFTALIGALVALALAPAACRNNDSESKGSAPTKSEQSAPAAATPDEADTATGGSGSPIGTESEAMESEGSIEEGQDVTGPSIDESSPESDSQAPAPSEDDER
jgi:hypothetical protein